MLLAKIMVSAGLVLLITMIAEKISTRFAGVLLGFPLGAGLSTFFFGLEQGAEFTAQSARWGIPGILACLVFALFYSLGVKISGLRGISHILISSVVSIGGYFVAAKALQLISVDSLVVRVLISSCGALVFAVYFNRNPPCKILLKVPLSARILLVRAGFTAAIIVLITCSAQLIGSQWAGLLTTFPVTLYPVTVILHYHYGSEAVLALFRELPFGLLAIVVFSSGVALSYPLFGIWLGFLLSYSAAFLYLIIYEFFLRQYVRRYLPG